MLIEARQQLALVLPMWCTAVARRGDVDGTTAGRCRGSPWRAELRAADALHVRLPDRRRRRWRRPSRSSSITAAHRGAAPSGLCCRRGGHVAVLGAAAVGPARRQRATSATCSVRAAARRGRSGRLARRADPRRVGVRPPVLRARLDGRPPARGPRPSLLVGRRGADRVGAVARRGGDRRMRRRHRGLAAMAGDRRRGARRVRAGGGQDPAHRAVRHHRPELLLDLADRRSFLATAIAGSALRGPYRPCCAPVAPPARRPMPSRWRWRR